MLIPFQPTEKNVKGVGLVRDSGLFAKYGINPTGVLHIGANVGEEAPVYEQLGIKKQIWIEGNPEIFLKLKNNISHNPQAVALNYVIGDENKPVTFHIANNGSQSSSVLELGTHKEQHPDVHFVGDIQTTMHRIDSLGLDLEGVDFLNIDLQGFEWQALQGMGDLINKFKWAYLEVNKADVYRGCVQLDSMDLFMLAKGFRRVEVKFVGNWGDALYVRWR
jgi:FkbM family methyltransferase